MSVRAAGPPARAVDEAARWIRATPSLSQLDIHGWGNEWVNGDRMFHRWSWPSSYHVQREFSGVIHCWGSIIEDGVSRPSLIIADNAANNYDAYQRRGTLLGRPDPISLSCALHRPASVMHSSTQGATIACLPLFWSPPLLFLICPSRGGLFATVSIPWAV